MAQMTRVLITGAAGFIGHHFTRTCLERGWHVTTLDRLDSAGNQARLAPLQAKYGARCEVLWHDLRAELKPQQFPERYDYIVHMAAGSHVERSVKDPLLFVADNVLGTVNILEYVRHHQKQAKLLYFSTDEVFGPAPPDVSFHEHARHEPENPYAASKAAAEQFCPAYAHQCGLQIVVTHCGNVYGPGQDGEKFIPLVIGKLLRGETVQIHSRDGVPASRLYIHVDDVCRATLTALLRGGTICDDHTGRYNIVADREWSNIDVACLLAQYTGRPLHFELVENPPNRVKPDMRYALTDNKLGALGFEPRVKLEDGLRALVEAEARDTERPAASMPDAFEQYLASQERGGIP